MKTTLNASIERGETRLITPYNHKIITHIYPSIGPGDYRTVGGEILNKGLLVPNGDYTASLVHAAYCSKIKDEPESQNIKEILKQKYLWVFNRVLSTYKGIYLLQDEKAIGLSQPLNESKLEKMLNGGKDIKGIRFSNNKKLRFAPKGSYSFGEHTPDSLVNDGFMIASYNLEGAEKLAEASSTFRNKPRTFGVEVQEGQTPKQRVSALGVDLGSGRLGFFGSFGDIWDGHAFGVGR